MESDKYSFLDRFLKKENFTLDKNVVKAYDTGTGEYVAIKRWDKDNFRGINEISKRSNMACEGIAPFICSFEDDDYRYMVCKWAEGVNLKEYIEKNGTFNEREGLNVFYGLCKIIVYLSEHEGGPLIYNDLKPDNIIINEDPAAEGQNKVSLIDFETCLRADPSGKNDRPLFETLPFGSYFFSAPEALTGRSTVFSDVYSAGAVLGFMLFGPKIYEDTEECFKKTDMGAVRIIRECMAKNEAYRRISPSRLLEKIAEYIETGEYIEEEVPDRFYSQDSEEPFGKEKETSVCEEGNVRKEEKKEKNALKKSKKNGEIKVAEKLSVCIDDNLCFATELAYACGESFKMKTLVLDSFTLRNRISSFMLADMVKEYTTDRYGRAGLEVCLYGDRETLYENGFLGITRDNEYLFTGTEALSEEIFETPGKLSEFYEWAYKNFDAVVLNIYKNTDKNIRDEILRLFNYVVIAVPPNLDDFESASEHYYSLSRQGKVYGGNVKYVAWDYVENQSLPEKGLRCITGDEGYLGAIRYEDKRYKMRNTGRKPEFYGGANASEYDEILTKILFGGVR